jgi:hypothetical protein
MSGARVLPGTIASLVVRAHDAPRPTCRRLVGHAHHLFDADYGRADTGVLSRSALRVPRLRGCFHFPQLLS